MSIDKVEGPGGPKRVDPAAARAREVASLTAAAVSLPEIRTDKVAAIMTALRQGTYGPDPRAVARAILEFEDGFGRLMR